MPAAGSVTIPASIFAARIIASAWRMRRSAIAAPRSSLATDVPEDQGDVPSDAPRGTMADGNSITAQAAATPTPASARGLGAYRPSRGRTGSDTGEAHQQETHRRRNQQRQPHGDPHTLAQRGVGDEARHDVSDRPQSGGFGRKKPLEVIERGVQQESKQHRHAEAPASVEDDQPRESKLNQGPCRERDQERCGDTARLIEIEGEVALSLIHISEPT